VSDRRPRLRVRPVSPEQARLARARAWELIFRAYDEGRAPQHARDQKLPDTDRKSRGKNTR
jgi:hypothetical protein